MGISFAITAYNEHEELSKLLNQLVQIVKSSDEIVIQLDNKATEQVIQVTDQFFNKHSKKVSIKKTFFSLDNHFANFKNNLKEHCAKDWIFQIDADETLSETFCTIIHQVLEANEEVDLIAVAS